MNKREVGNEYEEKAVQYLRHQDVHILERNYRNRNGEIDIIGKDNEYIIFIEVKYRKDTQMGTPEEAVNWRKQRQICKVADYYRITHGIGEFTPVRYDVVACSNDTITWHKNAFEHIFY